MLLVAAVAVACTQIPRGTRLNQLDAQLRDLHASPGDGASAERAKIAAEALATARSMRPSKPEERQDQIAWYRLAAVASVEARADGTATLDASAREGGAACDALPGGDPSAPRDCTLVRLAYPLGVTHALDRRASALETKRDAARTAGTKLGPPDLREAQQLFDGYESELGRVSAIAAKMPRQQLPPAFVASVETDECALYCRMAPVIRSALAVDGQSQDTVQPLVRRKEAARRTLEARLGVIDCRTRNNTVALPH
jgi:hypothetical protein